MSGEDPWLLPIAPYAMLLTYQAHRGHPREWNG